MIEVFMFDMGGVLSEEGMMAPRLLAELGFEGTNLRQIGPLSAKAIEECLRGNLTEEQYWRIVEKERHVTIPDHTLLSKYFTPRMNGDVIEVIRELKAKGKRVVCGTNVIAPHCAIHKALHDYDIFDAVYLSYEMHAAKPDRRFYEMVAEAEKVPYGKFFFTDDTVRNVDEAKSLGMQSFVFTDAAHLRWQLMSLEEL
jgi:HAD superfamily hydrolase (TIGR01509 family)